MNTPSELRQVAVIGFGEAGSILGEDLARLGLDVATYDILIDSPATRPALVALTVECLLAARTFNAEDEVLASLDRSFPQMGWTGTLPDYLVSRVAEHGRRRAAEMREVAQTLRDVGIEPVMASAIAERQQWLVEQLAVKGFAFDRDQLFSWRALADELEEHKKGRRP